ncbi:Odorant receptor 63 [Blattella germanica]|nr:Odorant receptor 63 [Blattella germanica]
MEQLPSEFYLKTQLKFSRNWGVWPWTEETPLWKKIFCKIIFYITLFLKLAAFACLLYHVYVEWGHLPNPIDNIILASALLNCSFGMIYIPYKIEGFLDLLKSMDRIFVIPKDESDDELERFKKQTFERYMKSAALVTRLFLGSSLATGIMSGIEPLAYEEGKRPFPLLVSFPFDCSSGIHYWYAYFFLMASWMSCCINGTINCDLFVSLIIKTTCQFHFLELGLLKIRDTAIKQKRTRTESVKQLKIKFLDPSEEELDAEEDDLMVQNLKVCIKYHQDLLGFAAALEAHVSPFVFMQMFVYFTFLCMNIFAISLVPVASMEFMEQLLFIICITCLLLILSWYGNELKLKSMDVAKAAYDCDWLNGPLEFKKSLVTLILRAQKPVILTALKFFTVDLNLFIVVMKTSYSYYQVLHTMYSKES